MDQNCVHFLQWALPHLDLQWSGFRKVRKQVCKRIHRRMDQLKIPDWKRYRQYLEINENEWKQLDSFCRVTISRFHRDQFIFDYIADSVFPQIIQSFPEKKQYSCISLGCASGEEPYTIAIMWKEKICFRFPEKYIQIIGLDADPVLLQRAGDGVYQSSCLRELPNSWKENAFTKENALFNLKADYKKIVQFIQADIRTFKYNGPYHLVFCRNLAATYFSEKLQLEVFQNIRKAMSEGTVLILGAHEKLPDMIEGFQQDSKIRQIYWAVE